jgi:hypothetical protein
MPSKTPAVFIFFRNNRYLPTSLTTAAPAGGRGYIVAQLYLVVYAFFRLVFHAYVHGHPRALELFKIHCLILGF